MVDFHRALIVSNTPDSWIILVVHVSFYEKVFLPGTETFLTFSQFQYQNFFKTFLAKMLEF